MSPIAEALLSAGAGIAAGHLITHNVEDIVTDALGMTVVFLALELTKGNAEARGSLALGVTAGALSGHYVPFGELAIV